MDQLKTIIRTLSDDDSKEFTSFINRLKNKSGRKDMELFSLLKEDKDYKSTEIISRLYNPPNKEAYHALRKRLLVHLSDFIVLKNSKEIGSEQSVAWGNLGLSRYLFDRQRPELAWKYLKKAEQIAKEYEFHDLLNAIYNLQIEKCDQQDEFILDSILIKHEENKRKLDEDERGNIANSIVKDRLSESKRLGTELNVEGLVSDVLTKYKLDESFYSRPRLVHDLLQIMRSAFVVQKDFYSFEPFIIGRYELIEGQGGFKPKDRAYKHNILYMIAHTLYRNKKFDVSERYLQIIRQDLHISDNITLSKYLPRWTQLKAAVLVYKGCLNQAADLLKDLLSNSIIDLKPEIRLITQVNLGIYQFHLNDFKASHRTLMSIYHTDNWCEKYMGKEWVLKKNVMEVLLFFELGQEDVAVSRIRSIERKYAELFKHPLYKRAGTFLKLIKEVVLDTRIAKTEEFAERVENSFDWIPFEQEDIHAIGFYAWLKSKMGGLDYHETLMSFTRKVNA